jgi:glycosyltransferase involved in cell wall biosynthesis
MPKVLRIINRFNLGGPTYNASYLTKYMAPEFETLLVGGRKDETEENSEYIVRSLGIEPVIIPEMRRSLNPYYDVIALQKIKKIIRKFKPDIVHTHASKAGALGRRAANELNVPVVIHTFHGHVFDAYFSGVKSSFYQYIERKLAEKSSKIIALSENQRYDLVIRYKICPNEKVEIIPLGFDLSRFQENLIEKRQSFRKLYKIDDDEIAIGIIGRIVPVKNHDLFVEAIDYIKKRSSKKIRAFIVGDGEDRLKIEEKARTLGIDFIDSTKVKEKATITFTSWLKDVDFVNAGMDIITLTSLNEGTPVSLIEAQAANKPIVTTKVGGIQNIVIQDKTALLSDIYNKNDYYENLLKMVEDDNLRNSFSGEGWNFVREKFHYTRLVNDMKNLYYNLLNK